MYYDQLGTGFRQYKIGIFGEIWGDHLDNHIKVGLIR